MSEVQSIATTDVSRLVLLLLLLFLMLLWLNGMTNAQVRHPIEGMMEDFASGKETSIRPLLADDEFFIQAKNGNAKVSEFIKQHAPSIGTQLLEMIVQQIHEVDDQNYDFVAVFPLLAVEFFELDLPPLTDLFFASQDYLLMLFRPLMKDSPTPEPQWAVIQRLLALLLSKDPAKVSDFVFTYRPDHFSCLQRFLNHIESATVNAMLIQLFNSENHPGKDYSEAKLEVVKLGLRGIEALDPMAQLNFTYLLHDIMTKYYSQEQAQCLVDFVISGEVCKLMFALLKKHDGNIFLCKSCAHILSLISNYYSYSMQNIYIDEGVDDNADIEYHNQLTKNFENSEFMQVLLPNLAYLRDMFTIAPNARLRTLRMKLLEIFDNLVRISNLSLWKQLSELNILQLVLNAYLQFPTANVFHSLFEKLLVYILNRAISDFHPYWTAELITKLNLYGQLPKYMIDEKLDGHILLLANHLNWFQRELSEKLVIDGSTAKYYQLLKSLEASILSNDHWRKAQDLLYKINQQNRVQLGTLETSLRPESQIIVTLKQEEEEAAPSQPPSLFQKNKNSQKQFISVSGDEPADYDGSPEQQEYPVDMPPGQAVGSAPFKEEEEYDYEKAQQQRSSPKKEQSSQKLVTEPITQDPNKTPALSQDTAQNTGSGKKADYTFVHDIYIEQSPPKDAVSENQETKKGEIQEEGVIMQPTLGNSGGSRKSSECANLTPNKKESISLNEFVQPIKRGSEKKESQSDEGPRPEEEVSKKAKQDEIIPQEPQVQSNIPSSSEPQIQYTVPYLTQSSSESQPQYPLPYTSPQFQATTLQPEGLKQDSSQDPSQSFQARQKLSSSLNLHEYVVPVSLHIERAQHLPGEQTQPSPKHEGNRVEDILKKYSGMSRSSNWGQIEEVNPYAESMSASRKMSMESSLRLKQLESEGTDEFRIMKGAKEDEPKMLVQPNDKRVIVVDELDSIKPIDPLSNSLSNMSFDSKSSRKRKVIWNPKRQSCQDLSVSSSQVQGENKAPMSESQQMSLSFQGGRSQRLRDPMRDSFSSQKSGFSGLSSITEKKYRQANKQDQQFLQFLKNIK